MVLSAILPDMNLAETTETMCLLLEQETHASLYTYTILINLFVQHIIVPAVPTQRPR
jgi:hypothetical protein